MKKLKKVLLILLSVICICGIATTVRAEDTGNVDDVYVDIPNFTNNTGTTQNPGNNTATTPVNNGISGIQNNQSQTSLPKTGANDTAMWVLIAACVGLAIYTYKKVRDYNV